MFKTLRSRFVLSHVLPLIVVIPLMGIALVYILETQLLLEDLSRELQEQAALVAALAGEQAGIWQDPSQASTFVAYVQPRLGAEMMLLDPSGSLLASGNPADAARLGQPLPMAGWDDVLAGTASTHTGYGREGQAVIVEVFVPVMRPNQEIAGVVRLSHQLATVSERFLNLRYLIAGVLAGGLVLGAVVGLVLALNLERPLAQVTQAIESVTTGRQLTPIPERGSREIRLLSSSVNNLAERLRNLEQARRQLLSNLVHELGRPLGSLRSAIQALQRGAGDEPALRQELLAGMAGEVDQLRRLVDDLSGLHSQVLGTVRIDRQPVALGDWLAQVLPPWREAAQAKGIGWRAEIAPDLPILQADPDRLAQALGNLLSNAVKFTPAGGQVWVAAAAAIDGVSIRVTDTGPGLAPEVQSHLFEPFYRAQPGRFAQGMGLGLSIARDLIVAHGGRLEVESTPGAGSTFGLWLPCQAGP